MASVTKWLPLESNPEVMNKFLYNLGVPRQWSIVDVFSLEDDLLQVVPRPVLAVLLLFPTTSEHEDYRLQQENALKASGQSVTKKVYYLKQTIKNACGTVALIHAVGNNTDRIQLASGSALSKFFHATKDMTPEERGEQLEKSESIGAAHQKSAEEGQTEAPQPDDDVNLHFIAFVHVDGHLYELDGRSICPINHGPTTPDTFLDDAAKVCKKFMQRDPDNVNFTVVALTSATDN